MIALEESSAPSAGDLYAPAPVAGSKLEVQSNDLVIATGAVRHEGPAGYAPIEFPAVPDYEGARPGGHRQGLGHLLARGVNF